MYPEDRLSLKLLVVGLLLVDLVAEAGHNILIYLVWPTQSPAFPNLTKRPQSTITNWGNPSFLLVQHWSMGIFLPANGLNSLVVQLFLLNRLWKL
jgi:hypothetical protein